MATAAVNLACPGQAQAEDLRDTLITVYNKSPILLAERARLRETDESYIQARAEGRVQVTASASYASTWAQTPVIGTLFDPNPEGNEEASGYPNDASLQVIQPLYQGGRVKALKQQTKLGILAARENLRAQENSIFSAAANAYIDVLRDEETARIRRNNVRVLSRQLMAATDRFDVGEGTRTDIAQSESRLALSESGLAQADAQLAGSRATYLRTVGRLPADLTTPPQFVIPPTLPDAIRAARDNNPQLLAAYYNEGAGRAAIDVAKAAGRPTISLNGTLARTREQLLGFTETDSASLTAQLVIPIYSGGANQSRTRQARHAKTRLAFETRDTELAVDQTITQIWALLEAARITLSTSERQQRASEVAFEGVSLEQTVGTRTQLDVLDAEQEVLNARLSVVEAQRALNAATFDLLSTIGVFDAEGIGLDVDLYDMDANLKSITYDGLSKAVDAYVPEFAQKIGRQVPDLVSDAVGVPVAVLDAAGVENAVEGVGNLVGTVGTGAKEVVDRATFQTPDYDDRLRNGDVVVVTEPVRPPSVPPYDRLLDADGDGRLDETYVPDIPPASVNDVP